MKLLWRFAWRLVLLALIALTLLQFWFFACVWYWSVHNPESTAFMRSRMERLREEDPTARLRYKWIPYRSISLHLKRAVIAAEDAKFLQHDGFDWDGIRKAYEKNVREGEVVAGGSTISQQLAKNLFLSGERTWWRKAQEAAITVMIEVIMEKRRILELYLNVIEWGRACSARKRQPAITSTPRPRSSRPIRPRGLRRWCRIPGVTAPARPRFICSVARRSSSRE